MKSALCAVLLCTLSPAFGQEPAAEEQANKSADRTEAARMSELSVDNRAATRTFVAYRIVSRLYFHLSVLFVLLLLVLLAMQTALDPNPDLRPVPG